MLEPTAERFSYSKLTGKMKNISTALAGKLATVAPKQRLAANFETILKDPVMLASDEGRIYMMNKIIRKWMDAKEVNIFKVGKGGDLKLV